MAMSNILPQNWLLSRHHFTTLFVLLLVSVTDASDAVGETIGANWPQFRGPNAQGVSSERGLPVDFGPTTNLLWKTALPPGHSSPCVWGGRLFLTAFKQQKELVVLCLDAGDGRIVWEREVPAKRIEKAHPRVGSPASATPATDGQRVYVFFGSVGVVCLDFDGRQLWRHELGPFTHHLGWGAASSPIVCGDSVIVNCDHDGESFLLALDKQTGSAKWRTPRPQSPPSYSTPVLWEAGGQTQLVIAGSAAVTAYDPATGAELWRVRQPGSFVATTPVVSAERLVVAAVDGYAVARDFSSSQPAPVKRTPMFDRMFENHDGNRDGKLSREEAPMFSKEIFDRIDTNRDGFLTREELVADAERQPQAKPSAEPPRKEVGNVLKAIRPGGHGDVTDTHVAWRVPGQAPYVPSPLAYGDYVYLVKTGGIVSCFEATTGNQVWKERLGASGDYYASPVAGDGKLFLVSEAGKVSVLAAGPKFQLLREGSLGERCFATPAIAAGKLYLRTESNLYCFGQAGRN